MIRPTITQYGNGEKIAIVTPFNREFVDDLKMKCCASSKLRGWRRFLPTASLARRGKWNLRR